MNSIGGDEKDAGPSSPGTPFGNALLGPAMNLLDPTNREFFNIASRGATPNVATPGVDPMMKHMAALGLTGHEMNGAGGRGLLIDGLANLGGWFSDKMPDIMEGVKQFFTPAERQFSSMGTFSAAAVGSLGAGVDNQILDVNKQQLAVLNRIDRKDDPWKVG